ncbi:hypothetical protein L1283_003205 [Sphingobacterium sp. HSC-15S19]
MILIKKNGKSEINQLENEEKKNDKVSLLNLKQLWDNKYTPP